MPSMIVKYLLAKINGYFFFFFFSSLSLSSHSRVLCICGDQTHLATGSLDRTIIIWLIKTGKLCQTLTGHVKGVWTLKFLSTTLLISGAYDCTLKVTSISNRDHKIIDDIYPSYGILSLVLVYVRFFHTMVLFGRWHVRKFSVYPAHKIEQLRSNDKHTRSHSCRLPFCIGTSMAFT
jgi:WD40 repeat protein